MKKQFDSSHIVNELTESSLFFQHTSSNPTSSTQERRDKRPSDAPKKSSNPPIREIEEVRKGESEDSRKRGNEKAKVVNDANSRVTALDIAGLAQRGDEKYGVEFTDAEREGLDELKNELRRKYGVKVSKNTLIRYTVYLLINDYCENGEKSIVLTKIREYKAKAG